MHPLISQDLAGMILDERIKQADRRRLARRLPRRRSARSALGLRLVSFGARLALDRDQEAAFLVGADRGVHLTALGPQSRC
ncbi:MAG: hypothetical protein ACRDJL_01240 [Actinomycetota bacterium]